MNRSVKRPVLFRSCLSFLLLAPGLLSAQQITVLNSASFNSSAVAPGSIVSIFGSNLANGTAATTDASHPPLTLGGASVTVGGATAALYYVSPTLINAVLSPTTPTGSQPVVVTSATGTVNGTVNISVNAPPGLFSLSGTGTRDGAIVNALTGQLGSFSVRTGTSATYLALFGTGGNFTTPPTVTIAGVQATVTYAGASPCCVGLQQINVVIPDSLSGAGRVPIVMNAGGQLSNVVEIVVLPNASQGEFPDDAENQTRSREISALAYVPGTSLALSADENDDVVRVLDLSRRAVSRVVSLPGGSEPVSIAVNSTGKLAVIAERNRAKVAILDLTSWSVVGEVAVGYGPVAVAIAGNQAVVVNGDANSVTIVDIVAKTAVKTIAVGSGPRGVAIDSTNHAWVTNESAGTLSVVDLASLAVTRTVDLGSTRPSAIQILANTFAIVSDPATGADGKLLAVNLTTGMVTTFSVNTDRSGGAGDIVIAGTTAYVANQSGGSISVLPLQVSGTNITGTATTIRVDLGPRALAVDTADNLLLVANEGTGTIVLIDISTGRVVGRFNAVTSQATGSDQDDHGDRDQAANLPSVQSVSPATGRAGTTFTLTVMGTNLTGATGVEFVDPTTIPGQGKGRGNGNSGNHGKGAFAAFDQAYTASNVQVNAAGTQLTATITVAAGASPGIRVMRAVTANGESSFVLSASNTFTLLP